MRVVSVGFGPMVGVSKVMRFFARGGGVDSKLEKKVAKFSKSEKEGSATYGLTHVRQIFFCPTLFSLRHFHYYHCDHKRKVYNSLHWASFCFKSHFRSTKALPMFVKMTMSRWYSASFFISSVSTKSL